MKFAIFWLFANLSYAQTLTDMASKKQVTFDDIGKTCYAAVFYASWCVACSGMMKQLKHDKVGAKPICPISVDTGEAEANSYFKEKPEIADLTKTMYFDKDGEFAQTLKLDGIPTTLLFDDQGKIKQRIFGKK